MKALLRVTALSIIAYARADHPDDPMHQLDPHAEFLDTSTIDSVEGVVTATVMLGSEVYCEAAHELGTAAHYYGDFVAPSGLLSPPETSEYSSDSILAYKCGVRAVSYTHLTLPTIHLV